MMVIVEWAGEFDGLNGASGGVQRMESIYKMTPERFMQIRQRADLSRAQLAKLLRIKEVKTIYRYEHGEREISGPVSLLMEMIEQGKL